ncbi:MAG: hypothetical protein JNM68_14085 [Dinghuibacter sp.]|nr:hypothetical protein [Dinghuibacter sp.]
MAAIRLNHFARFSNNGEPVLTPICFIGSNVSGNANGVNPALFKNLWAC